MPIGSKLRCRPLTPPFQVVLVEPEIPPNTGTIARTCAATNSPLHLIEPLGFDTSDAAVRRAGLDYWHLVDVHRHPSFEQFQKEHVTGKIHLFSSNATSSFLEATYNPGDTLVFGKESSGLPPELLEKHSQWGIPTSGGVRSLNLSNAVSIVLYHALQTSGTLGETFVE